MATKNEKSKAELYREERKKRLAKATKKKKQATSTEQVSKVIQKVFAMLLILAMVIGIGWIAVRQTGLIEQNSTVMTVGSDKISSVVFNYYYRQGWQGLSSQVKSLIAQYGDWAKDLMGFDPDQPPSEQEYPKDEHNHEEGEAVDHEHDEAEETYDTWADYFSKATTDVIHQTYSLYHEALQHDEYKSLSEEDQKNIDNEIEDVRANAAERSFSLNAWLRESYGRGCNEKTMREIMRIQMLAQNFQKAKQEEIEESYTDEILKGFYEKDRSPYDVVSYRSYTFTPETATKGEEESDEAFEKRREKAQKELDAKVKQQAEEFFGQITDEASFLAAAKELNKNKADYDADSSTRTMRARKTMVENLSEEAARWALDTKRKAGDTKLFADESSYTIVYMLQPPFAPFATEVRHILIPYKEITEDYNPDTVTDKEKAAARKKAEQVYQQWLDGARTEDSFIELVKKESKDEGSVEDGGLFEVTNESNLVVSFKNWALDPKNKPDASGIIESEYGCHIMYYVKGDRDHPDYMEEIRAEKAEKDYDDYVVDLMAKDFNKPDVNKKQAEKWTKDNEKWIKKVL